MNTGKTIAWAVWTLVGIMMSLLFNTLSRFVIPGEGKGYPLQYSGLRIPIDYSPWDHKELDMTEQLSLH